MKAEILDEPLKLYAVRNRDGKWFRAKGFPGSGETWVDSLQKAKIYAVRAQARGRITFFAKNYPAFGVPSLIELTVNSMTVLNEDTRVNKARRNSRT